DLVEDLVVELADQRRHALVDVGEVHDPAALGIEIALDRDLDLIAMAMHARALVARRHPGQEVRRLESIAPFEPHRHAVRFVARGRMLGKRGMYPRGPTRTSV